jgi:hypothetical protein
MESHEMDKLMSDIQGYLIKGKSETSADAAPVGNDKEELAPGAFISERSRGKIPAILMIGKIASCGTEICTIALFTIILLNPLQSWPQTLMLLLGVLMFGIFAITTIFSYQARIQLLLKIEDNTRSIAASKARIAETLEGIHIE